MKRKQLLFNDKCRWEQSPLISLSQSYRNFFISNEIKSFGLITYCLISVRVRNTSERKW
jgi:hypothetical protein